MTKTSEGCTTMSEEERISLFDESDPITDTNRTKSNKKMAELWKKVYIETIKLNYRLDIKDKTLIKKLVLEYGEEDVETVINHYVKNYQSFPEIKGHPTIGAMYGFRRMLFPSILKSGDKTRQSSKDTLKDDKHWNNSKKLKGGKTNVW